MKDYCTVLSDIEKLPFEMAENVSTNAVSRFAQLDLNHYKNLQIPLKKQNLSKYSNSFHFNSDTNLKTTEKVNLLGELHALVQNGVFDIVSLKALEKENLTVRAFADYICQSSQLGAIKFIR